MGFLSSKAIAANIEISNPGTLVPSGTILMYAGASSPASPPSGYLFCDGSSVLVANFPNLHAVIGYTFGGSGANFNLPNTQGIFVRGTGSQTFGSETYTGTLGTKQNDVFQSHTHTGTTNPTNRAAWRSFTGVNASNDGGTGQNEVNGVYDLDFNHTHTFTTAASGTGTETYPANIALNYIIKF